MSDEQEDARLRERARTILGEESDVRGWLVDDATIVQRVAVRLAKEHAAELRAERDEYDGALASVVDVLNVELRQASSEEVATWRDVAHIKAGLRRLGDRITQRQRERDEARSALRQTEAKLADERREGAKEERELTTIKAEQKRWAPDDWRHDRIQEIRALLARAPSVQPDEKGAAPTCACGKPATCFGEYEGGAVDAYACDDCCAHGNEDGHCSPVPPPSGDADVFAKTADNCYACTPAIIEEILRERFGPDVKLRAAVEALDDDAICAIVGHKIGPDHCGKPEHDYCFRCGEQAAALARSEPERREGE